MKTSQNRRVFTYKIFVQNYPFLTLEHRRGIRNCMTLKIKVKTFKHGEHNVNDKQMGQMYWGGCTNVMGSHWKRRTNVNKVTWRWATTVSFKILPDIYSYLMVISLYRKDKNKSLLKGDTKSLILAFVLLSFNICILSLKSMHTFTNEYSGNWIKWDWKNNLFKKIILY